MFFLVPTVFFGVVWIVLVSAFGMLGVNLEHGGSGWGGCGGLQGVACMCVQCLCVMYIICSRTL